MDTGTWTIAKGDIGFRAARHPQYEWFWQQVTDHVWEENTFDAFRRFIPPGGLYIDIGAWIGPTVLFAGTIAGRIVAVEPDAVAMSALLANLDLNPEIAAKTELYNLALAPEAGTLELYARQFGDSMTSLLPERGHRKMTFATMGIGAFLARAIGAAAACFIKLDVEGAEYELAPLICDYLDLHGVCADIYISLHAILFIDEARSIEKWTANVARNGRLLARLADYGTIHFWNGSEWAPCLSAGVSATMMSPFLDVGGLSTTILVRKSR